MRKLLLLLCCWFSVIGLSAQTYGSEGYPEIYLRGSMTGDFAVNNDYKFNREGDSYSLYVESLDGKFKIADKDWTTVNHTCSSAISYDGTYTFNKGESNTTASGLKKVTISFTFDKANPSNSLNVTFKQEGSESGGEEGGGEGGEEGGDVTPGQYYVYFDNTDNWAQPCVWAWSGESNCTAKGTWPGDAMTKTADGKWYWELPAGKVVPSSIIFNNNNNGIETKTLTYVNGATYKSDGSYTGGEIVTPPVNPPVSELKPTGTLPVLYINVYTDATHSTLQPEIIDKNLAHKNYFSDAEYWLDVNGCQWLMDLGATSVGSEDAPLPLEIKARGNFTRKGYSKKPFKLKLGSKQNLLNMNVNGTKSKHWAILAHADDSFGYMRNFVGFRLGEMIGLPWTPRQQPIEVVINGDYRGIYFLTESIRVGDGRLPITELGDNVSDPALVSGGYLVELDNYYDDCTFALPDASNSNKAGHYGDLMVTADTPEEYSSLQMRFVKDQFTKMNDLVNSSDDSELWKYLDLDDAARYYVVEEIISHYEAYHGSTYLMRNHGENQKWHFSPLWDCGHAFDGPTDKFFPAWNEPGTTYGNNWIGNNDGTGLRSKTKFMEKVKATFQWFVNKEVDGSASPYERLQTEIDEYVDHIKAAALQDAKRWKDAPKPTNESDVRDVVDNSDIDNDKTAVKGRLNAKITWLKSQWGDQKLEEPEHDKTPAADLPEYAKPGFVPIIYTIYVKDENASGEVKAWITDDLCEGGKDVFGEEWSGSTTFTQLTAGDGSDYYKAEIIFTRSLSNAKLQIVNGSKQSPVVELVDGRYYNLNGDEVTDFDPSFVPEPTHLYVIDDAETKWGNVNMWLYITGSNYSAQWPGEKLQFDRNITVNGFEGAYSFTIPAKYANGNVIFSYYKNAGDDNVAAQYPEKEGLILNGKDMVFHTKDNIWEEVTSIEYPWSGTLPLVRINTPAGAEIGYGDDGAVKGSTFEIDALGLEGVAAVGPAQPGNVTIKGRGKTYWDSFEKKAYKLKFKEKVAVLGMPQSKHWVLMPYANDAANGLLTNYTGHELSRLIGLEWTPSMKPVEVVLNGDYIGLYFIAENVRAAADRVQIADYGDPTYSEADDFLLEFGSGLADDGTELFYSWTSDNGFENKLVTSTPAREDIYDKITVAEGDVIAARIRESLAGHVDALKAAVAGAKARPMSADWTQVIDPEQAAKYYVVQEIMDDAKSFTDNFYMHHTTGSRWMMGPVWDFGNAFTSDGNKTALIHENEGYNGSFIKDLYANRQFVWFVGYTFAKFVDGKSPRMNTARAISKTAATGTSQADFDPTMNGKFADVSASIDDMVHSISDAVVKDAVRWPQYAATSEGNALAQRAETMKAKMAQSQTYLATPATEEGAGWNWQDITTGVEETVISNDDDAAEAEYFDVMGRRVANPQPGSICIVRRGSKVSKVLVK